MPFSATLNSFNFTQSSAQDLHDDIARIFNSSIHGLAELRLSRFKKKLKSVTPSALAAMSIDSNFSHLHIVLDLYLDKLQVIDTPEDHIFWERTAFAALDALELKMSTNLSNKIISDIAKAKAGDGRMLLNVAVLSKSPRILELISHVLYQFNALEENVLNQTNGKQTALHTAAEIEFHEGIAEIIAIWERIKQNHPLVFKKLLALENFLGQTALESINETGHVQSIEKIKQLYNGYKNVSLKPSPNYEIDYNASSWTPNYNRPSQSPTHAAKVDHTSTPKSNQKKNILSTS